MNRFEFLVEHFTTKEAAFTQHPELNVLAMHHSGANGEWECFARMREEAEQFLFYSILPQDVPEARRQEVAEFLTRVNYGMLVGNYEMDFGDGEVRFKTSADYTGDRISGATIDRLVMLNLQTFDRYLPALEAVIAGERAPAAAVAEIEG